MLDSFARTDVRPLRFAMVGCGRIARNHVEAIRQHAGQAELSGVCDALPRAAEELASEAGARAYRDLPHMLAECSADAVILVTPSGLHAGQAMKVAASGRHVITEKPMATRWEDGRKMVAACDEAGVRLFVVKQARCNPVVRLLKRAVENKRFGRIHAVSMNVFWTRPQEYYAASPWRGTWEFDGGALMNQASHYVDLLGWLFGPVESVQACTATLARNIETEDTAAVALRWRSGALGTMNVTMLAWPRNFEASLTVIGEKGTVRLGGPAANQVQHWEFADQAEDDLEAARLRDLAASSGAGGHAAYYDNVLRVLRGEAEPGTDGREGLKSLEVLVAIYRSARDARRVTLPLDL